MRLVRRHNRRCQPASASRRRHDSTSGAAALEFALILPVLVLLVCGIIEFGFVFQAQLALTHAAREGARIAAVNKWDAGTPALVRAQAFPVAPVTITTIPANLPGATSGTALTITLTHAYDWRVLPFPGTVQLQGTATMRKE